MIINTFPFETNESSHDELPYFEIRTEAEDLNPTPPTRIALSGITHSDFSERVEELSFKRYDIKRLGLKDSIIYRRRVHLILNFTIGLPAMSEHRVRIHFIICETEFFDCADDWKAHFSAYQDFIDIKGIIKRDCADRRTSSNDTA
jgi:hypothetical protein